MTRLIEVVELFRTTDARWRWRYRAGEVALDSNETYDTAEEAEGAARTAYPGLVISVESGSAVEGDEAPGAISWLALLLVIVVLLRARKSR
ncbi:MAG: hypothetical protein ACRDJV_10530 [Actinomycetota bacterium]